MSPKSWLLEQHHSHLYRLLALVGVLGLGNLPSATAVVSDPVEPTISVTGDAEVRAVPDEVIITAGILTRAKSVAAASEENDTKVKMLREFLKQQGIEDKYISTTFMQISPIEPREDYQNYSKTKPQQIQLPPNSSANNPFGESPVMGDDLIVRQPVGYQVNRTFSIKLSDVKKFEAIYKGIVNQGINMVSNVEFQTSQLRKLRDQARLMAVKAAREKATAMAEQLGAGLAAVRTIQEHANTSNPFGYAVLPNSFQSRSDPFDGGITSADAPGQISITASVHVVFVLKDAEL